MTSDDNFRSKSPKEKMSIFLNALEYFKKNRIQLDFSVNAVVPDQELIYFPEKWTKENWVWFEKLL